MKRNLLLPIIFSQALCAHAWTEKSPTVEEAAHATNSELTTLNDKLQALCNDKSFTFDEQKHKSNKIWQDIVDEVNNARIELGIDEDAKLTERSSIGVGKESISEASSNGKYLGIDRWDLKLGVSLIGSEYADLGIGGRRQVTFIQQFPDRCRSLIRVAYDPLTKVPLNSERALNRLKPGDFVAFSSPLTIGLGKGISSFVTKDEMIKALGGFSIYATGEFNIHVYRMEDNYVRVRFFAAKTKGADINPGLRFYALDGLLKLKPIETQFGMAWTNLFSADYVFNLNDPASRLMYDKVMGEKFELKKVLNVAAIGYDTINPFGGDKSITRRLYSDLGEIEEASLTDLKKPLKDRRVIRLSKGETETFSKRRGIGVDIKVIKLRKRTTFSDSLVSFFDVMNENEKYVIKTISDLSEYNFFEYWGEEDHHNNAMLVKADSNFNPLYPTGLQNIRVKEELTFTADEIRGLNQRLQRLPEDIKSLLKLPNPKNGDISKARIEQSIFFDTQVLESQGSINYESVKAELARLFSGWGKIRITPQGLNLNDQDNPDSRVRSYNWAENQARYAREIRKKARKASDEKERKKLEQEAVQLEQTAHKEYLEAFSEDIELISKNLSGLFGKEDITQKLEYYNKLQKIPLFEEMGITLILNLIDQADKAGTSKVKMKDVVSYRLSITGRRMDPLITEYPAKGNLAVDGSSENKKKSEIFQRILNDNAYLTDRSFNLRYYMDEKGDSLSLEEVVARSTSR